MTTDLEKQFFDTFGVEPRVTTEPRYFLNSEYYEVTVETYPQITDTYYLKLINIMSKELSMVVNLLSENIQELKSEILDKCIRNYHRHKEAFSKAHREYADDFKHQVRTLFEENN